MRLMEVPAEVWGLPSAYRVPFHPQMRLPESSWGHSIDREEEGDRHWEQRPS